MAKKIQDILPPGPKKEGGKKKPSPIVVGKKAVRKQFKEKAVFTKEQKIKGFWLLIPLLFIFVIVFGYRIAKADVKIWPKTESVSYDTEVEIDTGQTASDFKNKIISGKLFSIEETISENFPASGKVLKKAEGIIRLYNEYTTKSENWLQGTRFVSDEGKLFKSKYEISVPGAEIKNGKTVASYIDVEVTAAEPGEEYNIGPSHFSIIAYKGTPRYTKYYGESLEPMKGGGESPQATESDLKTAEESLTDKVKSKAEEVLKEKLGKEFIFLNDAVKMEIIDRNSSIEVGGETGSFDFQLKAKLETITFSKEEIGNFAKNFISSQIPKGQLMYAKSLEIGYTPKSFDFDSGKLYLYLTISSRIYPEINLEDLKKALSGRGSEEATAFLQNRAEITRAEMKLWPFWVVSVPNNLDKIEITYPIID